MQPEDEMTMAVVTEEFAKGVEGSRQIYTHHSGLTLFRTNSPKWRA
jgi:hypothetical protein